MTPYFFSPTLLLFPCDGEGLAYMVPCAIRSERVVIDIQDTPPSSPTTPCLLDLFPCQSGDLARVVPSATRNERGVSLGHLRNISREEREIEIANKVSTELPAFKDPGIWKIKKTLTKSDVGAQTRLLIPKESVTRHILKYLSKEEINLVEDEGNHGLRITVFRSEEISMHQLSFKRWNSAGSYVLNNNWGKDFVQRRYLKKGNEIGFFWNSRASRLHFRVLHS